MLEFLNRNEILSPNQCVFRKGLSTTKVILNFVKVLKSYESIEFYIAHFLDLSKAFDCVSHHILLP